MSYRLVSVTLSYGPEDGPQMDVLVMVECNDGVTDIRGIEAELEAQEEQVREALRPFLNNRSYLAVNGYNQFSAVSGQKGTDDK